MLSVSYWRTSGKSKCHMHHVRPAQSSYNTFPPPLSTPRPDRILPLALCDTDFANPIGGDLAHGLQKCQRGGQLHRQEEQAQVRLSALRVAPKVQDHRPPSMHV